MTRRRTLVAALPAVIAVIAGCGGEDDGIAPVAGTSVGLETVEGQVLIREPDEGTFATLEEPAEVPIKTEIDASQGTVRMTSATPDGETQTGEFSRGGFQVSQDPDSAEVTLKLSGGDFSECQSREARQDRSTVGGPVIRKLFVEAEGDFRTEGRFAAAAIRGTRFTAVDACFGTLTDVAEGVVAVTDLTADREITLRGGEDYWAAQRP